MNLILLVLSATAVLLLWWWKRRDIVPQPPTQTPLQFIGGYVTYPTGANYDTEKTNFSCKFKTSASSKIGVIAASTAENFNHFVVRLFEGKIVVEIGGNGMSKIKDDQLVNDNAWHSLTFTRDGLTASLTVDGATIAKTITGTYVHTTKPSVVTLGGAKRDNQFIGCIKDVFFNGRLIPDSKFTIATGQVLKGCV